MRRVWRVMAAGVLLAFGSGCGEEAPPAPSGGLIGAPSTPRALPGAENRPPVISRVTFEPRKPRTGSTVRARVGASDPDGDVAHLRYEWSVDGQRVPVRGDMFALGPVRKDAQIEVTVFASDGRSQSQPRTAKTTVANTPPTVTDVRLDAPNPLQRGDRVRAEARAEDVDGDAVELRYEWLVNDRPVAESGNGYDTSGLRRGDRVRVRVSALDGEEASRTEESEALAVGNVPPEIVSSPEGLGEDGIFEYRIVARDPDGDRNLRYELVKGPDGMTIDAVLGIVRWNPGEAQAGANPVELRVVDSEGSEAGQAFEIVVRELEAERQDQVPAAPQRY